MSGRHATRSKTGCFTCRTRKIKCDSVQPCCARCKKAQLSCEWRTTVRRSRAKPPSVETRFLAKPLRKLLPLNTESRLSAPSFSFGANHISLANSLHLTKMDQEYLAFVPHTMLVHTLGKSWKWGSARYLHCHVAQYSPIVMMMLLAISADELESRQTAEESNPRRLDTGVNYYRGALQRFSATLNNQEYQSERGYNEIFAVFFLMLYYEKHFGTDLGGLRAHLRGVHAFLKTHCLTGSAMQGGLERLPILSQLLLLYITYLHLGLLATHDFTSDAWEDTVLDDLAALDMDQVFRETRNVHSTLWGQEYPADEIIDDMSVFRPLELYHECNKFKSKMLRVFQEAKSSINDSVSHEALHNELEQIGKSFRDLITLSKRTDFPMRRRELHTNYFAVAEYHALSLMCQKTLCVSEPRFADPLKDLISVSKKVVQQDSRTAVRLSWAFLIAAEWSEDEMHRKWVEKALELAYQKTGWTKFKLDKHRGTRQNLWNLVE